MSWIWVGESSEHRTVVLTPPQAEGQLLFPVCMWLGSLLVWFASQWSKHLQPLCSSGHVRFHTISSPLHHDVVPVFPTVLISLEVGGAHAFIIVVGIQTLLGVITLFDAGVNVLVPNFPCILIHLNLNTATQCYNVPSRTRRQPSELCKQLTSTAVKTSQL